MILAAAAFLVAALLLWWLSGRLQRRSGLPAARVRQSDMGPDRAGPLLDSARYRLRGRPDYLLEVGGRLIPVEVKPTRQARRPYESDVMQLVAYCLLVEEESGHAPPYGILRYANQSWELPYTPARRARLIALLQEMHAAAGAPTVARNHNHPARCADCSQRSHCDQQLPPPAPG